jgi:hypothetical protein
VRLSIPSLRAIQLFLSYNRALPVKERKRKLKKGGVYPSGVALLHQLRPQQELSLLLPCCGKGSSFKRLEATANTMRRPGRAYCLPAAIDVQSSRG